MSRIIKFFHHHPFETFLFLVVLILCLRNYSPGTFLSGWDNLHPEFNILENIKRSVFSVWQEYQGLGLLAGMAHASDLVRQLIILPLTLFLPTNIIRYLWHFSMLFWGTFGLFSLVFYFTKNKFASLVAALFYLLNFATVQYFYLPFDPYSTFWGFFPWLIYFLFKHLEKPASSSFKKLIIINLLATPSFYVQTLFIVYIICISLIFLIHFFTRSKATHLLNYSSIYLIIFLVNSFWLIPNIYFTLTNASTTQNSMQNIMVTDQFVEQNLYRGNIKSFAFLQGQYYDTISSSKYLMGTWHQHHSHFLVAIVSILFILISLCGIFSKNKYKKYIIAILIFALIAFLCNTFPFNYLNSLFRQIPLVDQIFRNSFTKLLVPMAFSLSVLLGMALSHFHRKNLLLIPLLAILTWPSFSGFFISPSLRVSIPQKYFELSKYLNNRDQSKRILNLPQYNYWGWTNYKWDFSGSGFLWYAINQPITDRAFDVWDSNLENFYWQLHYALISRDSLSFQALLKKYNISYILFDPNVIFPESYNSSKVVLENQKLLEESKNLTLEKEFENLKLYSVNPSNNSLVTFSSLPNLDVPKTFSYLDWAFIDYSHYQSNPKLPINDIFPNSNLFSNHPNLNTSLSLQSSSTYTWTSCISTDSKDLSVINKEQTSFFTCGQNLPLDQGYLIKIDSKNLSGRPLLIKIFSLTDNRLIIDSRLNPLIGTNYFIVPPIYPFDTGIGINLSSLSLSNNPSINQINQIEITPFDWKKISNVHISNPTFTALPNQVASYQFNQSFYKAYPTQDNQTQLVLFQSYNPAWIAINFDHYQIKILDHYQVNNWANAWDIKGIQNDNIYILFWPQLLEYLGFILLLIPLSLLLKPQNPFPHNP